MAKLDGPLMSMGASGSIGGILTFGSNKGRNFVRQLVIPANPKTAAQQGVRSMMAWGGAEWAQLSAPEKATFETYATQLNISPFNAFIKIAMNNWSNAKSAQSEDPAPTVATAGQKPTSITATVIERRAQLDWTDDAIGSDDFGVILYLSQTNAFTPGRDNAVKVIDMGVETALTNSLEPGVYYYRMATFDKDGTISAASTQATFTIS